MKVESVKKLLKHHLTIRTEKPCRHLAARKHAAIDIYSYSYMQADDPSSSGPTGM